MELQLFFYNIIANAHGLSKEELTPEHFLYTYANPEGSAVQLAGIQPVNIHSKHLTYSVLEAKAVLLPCILSFAHHKSNKSKHENQQNRDGDIGDLYCQLVAVESGTIQ